jgi:hypothetical protein
VIQKLISKRTTQAAAKLCPSTLLMELRAMFATLRLLWPCDSYFRTAAAMPSRISVASGGVSPVARAAGGTVPRPRGGGLGIGTENSISICIITKQRGDALLPPFAKPQCTSKYPKQNNKEK